MNLSICRILLILPIIFPGLCHAQNHDLSVGDEDRSIPIENKWLGDESTRILKLMGVTYCKPPEFDEAHISESFDHYPRIKKIISYAGNILHSQDGQCMVSFPLFPPFTANDTLYIESMKRYSPDDPLRVLDMQHMWQIRANIIFALGHDNYFLQGRSDVDWRQYLKYYPEEQSRSIFNADTAFRVSLNLEPGNELYDYQGKYKYLDALVLQKMGRGYILMYVFTTDEGQQRLPHYWKQIEGIFRYEDE